MTVTLRVEEFVPYTSVVVAADTRIDVRQIDQVPAGVDVLGMAFGRLRERVNEAVDREMKERGIVLGEDGLRK